MLLRSISKHVKDQNWFAVALDFFIVVAGMLIAFQITNWNEAKTNKVGVIASLERLDKEVSQNLKKIDDILIHFERSHEDMNLGRDAINSCTYSPEAQAALERMFFNFTDDILPNFVTVAIDKLADQDRYQTSLSAEFQDAFGAYTGELKEEYEQLSNHYDKMWSHFVSYHPGVTAYFPDTQDNIDTYEGWGFKLDRPFEEICADATFRGRFMNTLGFYTSIGRRLGRLKTEAETFQPALRAELERL